ncbi:MAG: TIM barrel protein [Promethearchaeota archaeon]
MFNNIKLGIKISINHFDLIPDVYENDEIIDFVEISLKPNFETKDLDIIKKLKLPYAIHLPNSNDGINFGDIKREKNNIEFIQKIEQNIEILQQLKPICYIIHPESGDMNYSISNLMKLRIKPLAIENMPMKGIHGEAMLGYNPIELKSFFEKVRDLEFCFDINHAIKASISLKKDSFEFIKEFLNFKKPKVFHIAGGDINIEIDNHLHLNNGQYNLLKIKKLLLEYDNPIYLTFETPRNFENRIRDDLMNMEIFIKA